MIFFRRHRLAPYLLLLPSAAVIAVLVLWPTVQIAEFSFQNYGLQQEIGAAPTQWVGLSNYSHILHDPEFWLSLRLSVLSAAVMVPLTLIVGTLVGLLLSHLGPQDGRVRVFGIGPGLGHARGVGQRDLRLARHPGRRGGGLVLDQGAVLAGRRRALGRVFLDERRAAGLHAGHRRGGLAGFPFIAVTVLAGLRTIPTELFESARVDGAGPWRIFWRVTYPLMRPIFQVLFLLSVIWDFGVFTQVFIIIGELGQRDEYNLGIYEYATAFTLPPAYGLASALAFILTIILLIITVGYVRASVREGALR